MYKNLTRYGLGGVCSRIPINQLIMRLIVFLIVANIHVAVAIGHAQRINIYKENLSLREALHAIRKQSGYNIIIDGALLQKSAKQHIALKNASLTEALSTCLNGLSLGYEIHGKNVVIKQLAKKETPKDFVKIPERQEEQSRRVDGVVKDIDGTFLMGVSVTIRGQADAGTKTDDRGEFFLDVPSDTSALVFSYVGYQSDTVVVGKQRVIAVTLRTAQTDLGEVAVVAFGTQKKESVVSSIQTVDLKDLTTPTSNLTTALAGRIAGMISYQTSGEPGMDNADFFIRGVTTFGAGKVDPLILVDNVEVTTNDLANLHPDDLQSFSILKDATATALYGARGANGVILITTKEGKEGPAKISIRAENSISAATNRIEMADPITYMRLANEAVTTRDPLKARPYSESKIDNTLRGTNPVVYPQVDWMNMLIKDYTSNQRVNMNISGGGDVARYYVAASFANDNGILKVDNRNNFNNNIDYKKYLLHSNININLSKATEMIVRLHGTFNDYQGPLSGGSDLYQKILKVSPVRFQPYYEPDEAYAGANRILFGGSQQAAFLNPYAEMLRGYKQTSNSTMMAQLELKHNFERLVPGLKARFLANTSRYAAFDLSMRYNPFYYEISSFDRLTDKYTLFEINPNDGTEYLDYYPGNKVVNYAIYGEAALNYNKTFKEKHEVSGMMVGIMRQYLSANEATLAAALPSRNLGLSGRFTYGYDSRFFTEFNFGLNGSEKFDKGHRWGFFPSVGAAWNVSNEPFWPDNIAPYISRLKLRGTYGLAGNDAIGGQRFFYISEVNPSGGGSFRTGADLNGLNLSGYSVANYPNPNITWEVSRKINLGLELGLLNNKLEVQADFFREKRTNILQERADIPYEQGLWSTPLVNIGKAEGKGVDVSLDYKHNFTSDWWLVARGNFTYARSTYDYYEEAQWDLLGAPWRKRVGQPVAQTWGYVAERLFIDENDVANSARQEFSQYAAGDIKYKDMNQDNLINELDMVPIGYPTRPEVNYGFGISTGIKAFDFSFFFSGSTRSSFFINPGAITPFVRSTSDGYTLEGGLTKLIADDHWTEQSQNPYAFWPRLSDVTIANNTQTSSWYMYDGSFLRLKSAEVGYTLPKKAVERLKMSAFRVYLSGTNLFLLSKFKLWDIEMGGNGLNYPLQRVFNVGVNFSF